MDYILDKTVSNPDLDVNPDYILKKIASFYRLNFSSADFLSHERCGGLLMGHGTTTRLQSTRSSASRDAAVCERWYNGAIASSGLVPGGL